MQSWLLDSASYSQRGRLANGKKARGKRTPTMVFDFVLKRIPEQLTSTPKINVNLRKLRSRSVDEYGIRGVGKQKKGARRREPRSIPMISMLNLSVNVRTENDLLIL